MIRSIRTVEELCYQVNEILYQLKIFNDSTGAQAEFQEFSQNFLNKYQQQKSRIKKVKDEQRSARDV